jgi:hypothetical protein
MSHTITFCSVKEMSVAQLISFVDYYLADKYTAIRDEAELVDIVKTFLSTNKECECECEESKFGLEEAKELLAKRYPLLYAFDEENALVANVNEQVLEWEEEHYDNGDSLCFLKSDVPYLPYPADSIVYYPKLNRLTYEIYINEEDTHTRPYTKTVRMTLKEYERLVKEALYEVERGEYALGCMKEALEECKV